MSLDGAESTLFFSFFLLFLFHEFRERLIQKERRTGRDAKRQRNGTTMESYLSVLVVTFSLVSDQYDRFVDHFVKVTTRESLSRRFANSVNEYRYAMRARAQASNHTRARSTKSLYRHRKLRIGFSEFVDESSMT